MDRIKSRFYFADDRRRKPFAVKKFARIVNVPEATLRSNLSYLRKLLTSHKHTRIIVHHVTANPGKQNL